MITRTQPLDGHAITWWYSSRHLLEASECLPMHRDLRRGLFNLTVIAVSSSVAAPRFSSSLCSLVVPGIGTIHGF
jgi:hypothetical protein